MILQWDESFDIGSDTLTGVNDADYQPPFALTAKLNKLTLKVDRPQLDRGRHQEARHGTGNRRRRQSDQACAARTAIEAALHADRTTSEKPERYGAQAADADAHGQRRNSK